MRHVWLVRLQRHMCLMCLTYVMSVTKFMQSSHGHL